jgi:hypothetical protein
MHAGKVIIRDEGGGLIVPDPARLFMVSGIRSRLGHNAPEKPRQSDDRGHEADIQSDINTPSGRPASASARGSPTRIGVFSCVHRLTQLERDVQRSLNWPEHHFPASPDSRHSAPSRLLGLQR